MLLRFTPLTPLALSLTLASSPALAVTEAEFNELREQLEQMAEAIEASQPEASRTSIGGYGELHYNNLSNGTGPRKREVDFHRFVLYFNHEFSDSVRLFSELELEHALVVDTDDGSGPGEVELEQAYIQIDLDDNTQFNAGVFLVPVGILNETHEPPTFYGVERNPVEKNIIPTTWWEAGVMLSNQNASGLSYDVAIHSGLDGGTNIRGGRQKVAKAKANNWVLTGRVKYTGTPGLELAGTVSYQDDISQDSSDDVESATLIETHAIWSQGPFGARALYARWDIDGTGASSTGKDVQDGMYLEGSYRFTDSFGVFVRHNIWDNGGTGDTEKAQSDFGFNYWPHENVVFKFDIQAQDDVAGDSDGFNLGVGYQF